MDKIYEMELHEKVDVKDQCLQITRVAGGWVYRFFQPLEDSERQNWVVDSVFVPYHNEFQ